MPTDVLHIELALFNRISQGDEEAFEQLFRLYVPQLEPVVHQIVHSDTFVEDIIQEVFLHLWLGRHKFPQIEDPRNWIFRITYNRSFLFLKRKLLHEKARNELDIGHRSLAYACQTEESLDFAETIRLIRSAITELPLQARKIYQMNRDTGMKPADIAKHLGLSTQSVRNSLARSGKLIRIYLSQHGISIPLVLVLLKLI